MRAKQLCPSCNKPAIFSFELVLGDEKLISLDCGHSIIEKISQAAPDAYTSIISRKGFKPFPFQIDGVKFAERAGFNCLIADEMRVGKTIQALSLLRLHPELLPAILVVKANLVHQWSHEAIEWCVKNGEIDYIPSIIKRSEDLDGAFSKLYIISVDTLRSITWPEGFELRTVIIDECQAISNPDSKRTQAVIRLCQGNVTKKRRFQANLPQRQIIETIATDLMKYHGVWGRFVLNFELLEDRTLGLTECKPSKDGIIEGRISIDLNHASNDSIESVIDTILHEIAHAITPGAGHRPIWQETAKAIGGDGKEFANCDGSIEIKDIKVSRRKVIGLSGTPFKNHAGEYFTILNLIRPDKFHSEKSFYSRWVDTYQGYEGREKIGGIKSYLLKEWAEYTKDFIIRRTREEVMPDLPKVARRLHYIELVDKDEISAYKRVMTEFLREYDENGVNDKNMMHILAYITKMRHITGVAKISPAIDFLLDFLRQTQRKIVVFYHHTEVPELIETALSNTFKTDTNGLAGLKVIHTKSSQDKEYQFQLEEEFKNNASARVLLASTQASGVGKNWQFCDACLMLERQWNSVNEEQAEARFLGHGAKYSSVDVTYMTVSNSIDEYFAQLVDAKRLQFYNTMDGKERALSYDEVSMTREIAEILATKGRKAWRL